LPRDALISEDYKIAIEGWKARKDQLLKERESVTRINNKAEELNLVSLLKQQNN